MKMETKKNKSSAKRLIVILSLGLALLIALGAFSFAWIRNYIAVDTLSVKTGKLLYSFKLYREDGTYTPLFDTGETGEKAPVESQDTLEKNIENAIINVDEGEEVFFVVEKYADSIDFDVALSFDNNGLVEKFEYIGMMNYAMYDASSELKDKGITSEDGLVNYVKSGGHGENSATPENLGGIWEKVQKASVTGDSVYACIRMKICKNEDQTTPDSEDLDLPFRVNFCIAQTGAIDDEGLTETHIVDNYDRLVEVMNSYGFGDEIRITQDVNWVGDLVFTRPCTVTILRSTLTVQGNLVFSYMYEEGFALNTAGAGHVRIIKNNDAGGNFQIDLPNTSIDLSGANNFSKGEADIYVEGKFTANASTLDGKGLLFRGTKVVTEHTDEDGNISEPLTPIIINGSTRLSVSNRTRLGAVSANLYCKMLKIENNGYIDGIDLRGMTVQDLTLISEPCIFIDNCGTVGEDGAIYLPDWSKKFESTENDDGTVSYSGNTRIIANKGSSLTKAKTDNDDSFSTTAPSDYFFSNGNKGEDGIRDDIEYDLRKVFVETVDTDKTKIIIHYEQPLAIVLAEDETLAELSSLSSYVSYYSEKGDIAAAGELTDVTVICYGEKSLSADDYTFIKTMEKVNTLDLSNAVSVDMCVPAEAFNGMSALTSIKMSESDIQWGQNIFTNTGVDEITLPQSLTKLDNPINEWGNVSAQSVLDGVKYVRTSITVVEGMYKSPYVTQYLFTPDEITRNAYRELYGSVNADWNSKIFIDNGATRFNDFFLRYDPDTTESSPTCEFVVYTGDETAWTVDAGINYSFDFNKININGKTYKITSYDPYALYDTLKYEEALDITLESQVTDIGEYAFACSINTKNVTKGIASVTIKGNPTVNGHSFFNNDVLVSFNAPELTTLKGGENLSSNGALKTVYMPKLSVVEGNRDLYMCPVLETVDISVIERTEANKGFYTAENDSASKYDDDYSYASFYIHTENANDVSYYTSALAADYRFIFVKESYAKLYRATSTYTGVTEMGENNLDALIEADANGDDLATGGELAYYYIINENDEAELVACMLDKIDKSEDDVYTTIASFTHNDVNYPVTKIGSAAYHFTSVISNTIKIPDGITELGAYSFDARKNDFKKYCITLDLNEVELLGKYAFYYVDMGRIVGDALEEVGEHTFSYNKNLRVANLPNLSRSRPAGSTDTIPRVFVSASNLRVMYVGFSEDIAYDDTDSRMKNYIRFINFVSGPERITLSKVNTVINSGLTTVELSFPNNFVQVSSDFSGIYLSDFYTCEINLMGLSESVRLPGYIYHKQDNGELELIAVSPDVALFGDYRTNAKGNQDYITPSALYASGSEYTSKDNGTAAVFNVTSIGKYAYGAASLSVENFIVADSIKTLDNGALRGSAYVNSVATVVTLQDVKCLDLANVVSVGEYACYDANIKDLKADNLQTIAGSAFSYCESLETVYLPSFVSTTETNTFRYCSTLKEVTLGKNATTLVNNMFENCKNLQRITILNETDIVSIGTYLVSSSYAANVKVRVHAGIYQRYYNTFSDIEKYENQFGHIPATNFEKYGQATTTEDGLTYYWDIIDSNAKTAYIDYVEGTLSNTITLPASFTLDSVEYTVVSVSPAAIAAMKVEKIVLPSNMQYLSFSTSDLAETVTALEIAYTEDVSKFKTLDGVLYTADGKTLLVYPKAKADTTFTVANTVTEIFDEAFYGAKNIDTLTISGVVTIGNRAFATANIDVISFTNDTASVFAGRDILLGANNKLSISVPSASLNAYKANVLVDYSILDSFKTH